MTLNKDVISNLFSQFDLSVKHKRRKRERENKNSKTANLHQLRFGI